MATLSLLHTVFPAGASQSVVKPCPSLRFCPLAVPFCGLRRSSSKRMPSSRDFNKLSPSLHGRRRGSGVVCAIGDVSPAGTTYLIAGAIGVALLGSAFPLLFSRKDLCPECDGAGFIRRPGAALAANAARKDEQQIVCPTCKGLGKLNQVDK